MLFAGKDGRKAIGTGIYQFLVVHQHGSCFLRLLMNQIESLCTCHKQFEEYKPTFTLADDSQLLPCDLPRSQLATEAVRSSKHLSGATATQKFACATMI